MRRAVGALVALGLVVGLLGTAVVGSAMAMFGIDVQPTATSAATSKIPPALLALYQEAAATCPGLPWTVLAAIGTVESDNGQSTLPGVHSGANAAGAEGPMQFEPATFAEYEEPVPPGGADPPNPYDPTDAVYAAARLLCADGAAGGANLPGAVYAYNHSTAYVAQVLALAQSYGSAGPPTGTPSEAGSAAAEWALGQIGTPYLWGGETPGVGFDCSGLVQAAYEEAGVSLPRVAQDQYDATPKVPPGSPLQTGDLVFFGSGPDGIDHVGIFVGVVGGEDVMVDAPYTGADVRAETFPSTVGAPFGSLVYVGATRPSGLPGVTPASAPATPATRGS
jgi:cell wall-associated NlpC family hydrolase